MCSCETDYINKKNYHLKVGEKFEIYYTSNSCCGRCWNIETVENIEFIKNRTIEESDNPGATNDYAILFQAVKEGVDTLKTHHYAMSDSCNLNSQESDIYLIQVSK
jgi:predicted secreted protein